MCPLLVWNDVVYLPDEYYCFVLFTNVRGMLWMTFNIYSASLSLLLFIYFRITVFICQQSNNQSLVVKRNQQQDLLAIQQIFITNTLLTVFMNRLESVWAHTAIPIQLRPIVAIG